MAIDPKILRKLNLYRQNPDIVQPLSNAELADLVVLVLSQVEVIDKAIGDNSLNLTEKIGKEADYLVRDTRKEVEALRKEVMEQVRAQIEDGAKTLSNTSTELEKRVAEAIDNIRNGENGIITDEEIGRAAQIASELIELPDFESVVQTEVQANGEQIRNALELLAGDERYKVEVTDVDGLEDRLEQLKNIKQQGGGVGTSKPAVIRFVNEALNTGEITIEGLPTQTGNSGKFLTTDGTEASWATLAGGGDMGAATYDPTAVGGDAFDMDNMAESATKKILTATERTTLGTALQPADISDTAYGVGWNGDTGAASKNAIYDKIETLGGVGISNVVEDTTPQLGGDLDLNDNDITSTSGTAVAITKTGAGSLTVQAAAGGLNLGTTSGNGAVNITPHGTGEAQVDGDAIVTEEATQTLTNKTIDADNNTITNIGGAEFDVDTQDSFKLLIGCALDSPDVTVTSNGSVISLSIEKSGGGDIRYSFSDGIYTLDTTPADTVTLTAGSDTSPQINYVYLLQSTKALTVSTSGWPSEEHAHVATVLCQSAASLQTDSAYKLHVWTDHVQSTSGSNIQGHLAHLNEWIRSQNATWIDGVALTPTVGAGTFDIATSAGNVLQLHAHAMPAFDTSTGSNVYVVNDPTTAYKKVGDLTLANIGQDVNGTTLGDAATDFYNLVVWGAVNESSGDCKLFVNVPDGTYPNDNASQATLDTDSTAVYTIPDEFRGVGFLIARLTVSESGGTYTIEQNEDLRGLQPSTAAGGAGGGQSNEFIDNVFRVQDEGDVTKEIAFQASGITTGTTRTITMPDADVDLADVNSAMQDLVDDTTPVLGGDLNTSTFDIILGDSTTDTSSILLNDAALADEKWSGTTILATAGATIAIGDLCYLKTSDGEWYPTDGILDGTDTAFALKLGICVDASTDGAVTEMLLDGVIASAAFPAFTIGAPVYMSDTAGDMVVAQPSTTNFAIRIVGEALSATVLHFSPSRDYIVHV